jgi:hypothetical protein
MNESVTESCRGDGAAEKTSSAEMQCQVVNRRNLKTTFKYGHKGARKAAACAQYQ